MTSPRFHQREKTAETDTECRFAISLPEDSAFLNGHFPGNPILPGVAQMQICHDALTSHLGRQIDWSEFEFVRFRKPIRPGDTCELTIVGPEEEVRVAFQLRNEDGLVADGRMRLLGGDQEASTKNTTTEPSSAAPLDRSVIDAAVRYLPHRGPALLIERVVEASADFTLCVGRFSSESALARDGEIAAFNAVEAAAQASATHLAIQAVAQKECIHHLEGFLTGLKHMEIGVQTTPADAELLVRVTPRGGARGLYKFRFEVHFEEALVAKGELSTYMQVQATAQSD